MGEYADESIEHQISQHLGYGRHNSRRKLTQRGALGDERWTTAEGEVLRVRDMTPEHRARALASLFRRHGRATVANTRIGIALIAYVHGDRK